MTPTTFKEALKRLYAFFLVGAGVAIGLGLVGLVLILAYGGWPESQYPAIISILGKLAIGAGALMTLVVIFLGLGGAAQSIKATLWGASIETESDNDC
jgi:hypothetical protein